MIKSFLKTAAVAAALTFSFAGAQAETTVTKEVALFLTIKTQPGQRDALVALWETHLKSRAAENNDQVGYVLALDLSDPDTVHITEVYATQAAFQASSQAPWFAAYMAEAGELLAGEPSFAMASPHWVK